MPHFKENINLSRYCNYRIGGPARFFFEAKNVDEVRWAVAEAKRNKLPVFVLGQGTNLLISDEGFDGLVLRLVIDFIKEENGNVLSSQEQRSCDDCKFVRVGAGTSVEKLLNHAIARSLSGLEWAGGLPGTLGGAIRGNAGAFGGEIKDSVSEVESFDAESEKIRLRKNEECEFGYRTSIFKKLGGREIILSAALRLKRGDKEEIKKLTAEKISYRETRHPLEHPNIGSIFKNVPVEKVPEDVRKKCADVIKLDPFPVVPTARLIKLAGLKGKTYGGAAISPKHGNFIVNVSNAKASDVKYLVAAVRQEIKNRFGIELEEEVQIL